MVLLFFSTVTTIASSSRQIWAFSRDRVLLRSGCRVPLCVLTLLQGLPFSTWIRFVRPDWEIPLNAVSRSCGATLPHADTQQLLVCLAASLVLSAINFGSDTAFNAILSVSNAALIFSYIVSVGCVRLKRFRGEPLLPRRWSLGRWGAPINDISLASLLVGFIFSFFPTSPSLGDPQWAADFNWAIVIFGATCLLAMMYYFLGGRENYVAPVTLIKQE